MLKCMQAFFLCVWFLIATPLQWEIALHPLVFPFDLKKNLIKFIKQFNVLENVKLILAIFLLYLLFSKTLNVKMHAVLFYVWKCDFSSSLYNEESHYILLRFSFKHHLKNNVINFNKQLNALKNVKRILVKFGLYLLFFRTLCDFSLMSIHNEKSHSILGFPFDHNLGKKT